MNKIIFSPEEVDHIRHKLDCEKEDFVQTVKALLMGDIDSKFYPEFRILNLFDSRIKQHIANEYLRTHDIAKITIDKLGADNLGKSNLQGMRALSS